MRGFLEVLILKELWARLVDRKVTEVDLNVLREIEGPRGGRAWFAGHVEIVPAQEHHYSISVQYVNDYLWG